MNGKRRKGKSLERAEEIMFRKFLSMALASPERLISQRGIQGT